MNRSTYEFRNDRRSKHFVKGRSGSAIDVIVIHHWGVEGQKWENLTSWLLEPSKNLSVHYIAMDGKVEQQVEEDDTAWHGGNEPINVRSIGIECRPEATDGDYNTVAELIADIWSRRGKLPLLPHREVPSVREGQKYVATICPAKWDLKRLTKEAEAWFAKKYEAKEGSDGSEGGKGGELVTGLREYDFGIPYRAEMAIQGYVNPLWQGGYAGIKRKGDLIKSVRRVDIADNSFVLCGVTMAWYLVKANNRWQVSDARSKYTVKSGDNLWKIAVDHLGDGLRYTEIAEINGIIDTSQLTVGQVLRLPIK